MLSEIKEFVKTRFYDIMLFTIIVLIILFSFAAGYITAKHISRPPIQILNQK